MDMTHAVDVLVSSSISLVSCYAILMWELRGHLGFINGFEARFTHCPGWKSGAGSFTAALELLEKVLGWSWYFRGTEELHPWGEKAPGSPLFHLPFEGHNYKISPGLGIAYKPHLPLAAGSLQGQWEPNTRVWYNYFLQCQEKAQEQSRYRPYV